MGSNSRLLRMSVLHSVTMAGIWCLKASLLDIRLLTAILYCRPLASVNRDPHKSLKIAVVELFMPTITGDALHVIIMHPSLSLPLCFARSVSLSRRNKCNSVYCSFKVWKITRPRKCFIFPFLRFFCFQVSLP